MERGRTVFSSYLKDRKSWLVFFVGMLVLVDLILWLDQGITVEFIAVLYFNLLLLIFIVLFSIWRYKVETKFTKKLAALVGNESEDWSVSLPEPTFTQERLIHDILQEVAFSTSEKLANLKHINTNESDYLASWVHEVKAPLTAMKLTIDAHRHEAFIRKIESDWVRIHLLIDQQLSIARLPTLEMDYLVEKTSLQGLVSAEVREVASWCLEKDLAIEFEGDAREVVTDVKWCRFIIRQILTNAVKYSPVNGTIFVSMMLSPSGHAMLKIRDEGPGIPAHDLPRIFDKGFTGGTGRLHNAATGLGLYLAQTVAEKIGITVTAQSKTNEWTEISLIFAKENEFTKILT